MDYIKTFSKVMTGFKYRHDTLNVFTDMCHLGFIAIYNQMLHPKWQEFENTYIDIINQYSDNERVLIRQLLEIVVAGIEENPYRDVLGELYMNLNISNSERAQVFTPYSISQLMAKMTMSKNMIDKLIAEKGFVSINDPAVGGGSILLASAAVIQENGYDPAKDACFIGQDIDLRCVHMSYIHCYYNNLAAAILHGDTLSIDIPTAYYTPQWVAGNWSEKIEKNDKR